MITNQVISLYDLTGEALRPWADAGYECFAYDIQHDGERTEASVTYAHADLYDDGTLLEIVARHSNKVVFMSAFPPCTDLASSGALWWKKKAKANPDFQQEALSHVVECSLVGRALGCPFYIENPIGAVSRLWRKPDHKFDPYEYGGYLAEDDVHPRWPENIPPRDAYRKKTCLWTGGRFNMPRKKPVDYLNLTYKNADNYSPVSGKTGGKSLKTKNIRSATPRGFAQAVYAYNGAS